MHVANVTGPQGFVGSNPTSTAKICAYQLCNEEVVPTRKNKVFCCKLCAIKDFIARRRKDRKARCVALLGAKCSRCGYDRCLDALQFHHTGSKDDDVAALIRDNRPWTVIVAEVMKCVLVCANCHAEIHST